MAAPLFTGQLNSQVPQPMQRLGMTMGNLAGVGCPPSDTGMALCHPAGTEDDRLLGHGAHLLADQAVVALGPRYAGVVVYVGAAYDFEAFLLQRHLTYCLRGADLAALVAVPVTVAAAIVHLRRHEAFGARVEDRRLDDVGGA